MLGAAADCDLVVDHPTVSRRHAELETEGDVLLVRDLGSRNGVWIGGERVSEARVEPGGALAFGRVWLTVESVSSPDLELGLALPTPDAFAPESPGRRGGHDSTVALRIVEGFAFRALPELLQAAAAGGAELALAQQSAALLFEEMPVTSVCVVPAGGRDEAVLYEARRVEVANEKKTRLVVRGAQLEVQVELPRPELAGQLGPVVGALGSLLRLAALRSPEARPDAPVSPATLPAPGTLVPAVRQVYENAARVAQGVVGVLVVGESGTGKEVLARFLHAASPRASAPFVALNCAALPRDLLEAELFGVERGVATGVEARPGKFELANQGTLMLDEIADMALETQAKILRVLQEGEVYRLGGAVPRPARCRVVAASNRDVDALRGSGRFRQDLYYRIATWVVELPPLRHRRADIPNLAAHFLYRAAERRGLRVRGISRRALEVLVGYSWPGNVRQLENEMERAALFLGDGDLLEASRLSPEVLAGDGAPVSSRLEERLAAAERREILQALASSQGVVTAAAKLLGVSRSTLYRRMRALGLEAPGE